MTTLCIDELSDRLKQRWDWSTSATHVPLDERCPLLAYRPDCRGDCHGDCRVNRRPSGANGRYRAVVPRWLEPKRGHDGPPGIARLHGKAAPSMG